MDPRPAEHRARAGLHPTTPQTYFLQENATKTQKATCAHDSSISMVADTILVVVGALPHGALSALTVHCCTHVRVRVARGEGIRGCEREATAQLPAHHLGILHVPQVATHPLPASKADVHIACTLVGPTAQTQLQLFERHKPFGQASGALGPGNDIPHPLWAWLHPPAAQPRAGSSFSAPTLWVGEGGAAGAGTSHPYAQGHDKNHVRKTHHQI